MRQTLWQLVCGLFGHARDAHFAHQADGTSGWQCPRCHHIRPQRTRPTQSLTAYTGGVR